MVKRLQKYVQYIKDIRLNAPTLWPCRAFRSQICSVKSGVTGPNFTTFSLNIEASHRLLMRTLR